MRRLLRILVQFSSLFGFWVLVSGRLDVLGLGLGAATSLACTLITSGVLHNTLWGPHGGGRALPIRVAKAAWYAGWVITRMIASSVQIAYLICHPRMPIQPSLIHLQTGLKRPLARVLLANSITLVPGTLTVALQEDDLTVHALVPSFASELVDGRMQNRVAAIFAEGGQPQPAPRQLLEDQ